MTTPPPTKAARHHWDTFPALPVTKRWIILASQEPAGEGAASTPTRSRNHQCERPLAIQAIRSCHRESMDLLLQKKGLLQADFESSKESCTTGQKYHSRSDFAENPTRLQAKDPMVKVGNDTAGAKRLNQRLIEEVDKTHGVQPTRRRHP